MRCFFRMLLLLGMPLLLSAVELAPNGNFEQMSGKSVRNWNPARGWKGKTDYRSNPGVLCIERHEGGSGAYMSTPIPVVPGKKYTASVRWKATIEKGSTDLALYWINAKGQRFKYNLIKRMKKSFDVSDASGEVTAPEGAVSVQMLLVFSGIGNAEFYRAGFFDGDRAAAAAAARPDMAGNCVPNADFKLRKGKYPASWIPAFGWKGKSNYLVDENGFPVIQREERNGTGAYIATFPVKGGEFYVVRGEIKSENFDGGADIALQFVDAKNRIFGYQLIGRQTRESDWKLFQKSIQVPETAVKVRFLLVSSGKGKCTFRNPYFGKNSPDEKEIRKAENLLLNPSFEESDLQPEFIDSWRIVSGRARRSAGFSHGEHSLELFPGCRVGYGWDAPTIAVKGIPFLYRHVAVSGKGKLQFEVTFFDISGKKIASAAPVFSAGDKKVQAVKDQLKIPAGAVTASVALVNCSSDPVKVDALYLGEEPFSVSRLGRIIPVEKEPETKSALTMPVSTVRDHQGTPTWFIGNTPVVNSTFTSSTSPQMRPEWYEYGKKVLRNGKFPILIIGTSITPENQGEKHTLASAVDKTDFSIRAALAEIPDARFVIWMFVEPSFAFAAKYPDDIIKLENPSLKWASPEPPYSYGSEIWGRQCARQIKAYLYALRDKPYADRIVGISPGLGRYAENNHAHANTVGGYSARDFSPAMTNFFRQWLFREYKGDVKAFAEAWNRKEPFNFTNAVVPNGMQRVRKLGGAFYDSAKQRQVLDYGKCSSFGILHRVLKLFQGAKEATDGRIFTFAQFAYFTGGMGHRELEVALTSPYLDAFGPAPQYINRGPGDDIPDHGPAASVREHNKVWLCQADVRSHLASKHNWMYGRTENEKESVGVYLREIGHYMTSAIIPYHMTFEKWYDSPEIMKLVANFDRWMALSGHFPRNSAAEIAIVADPASLGIGSETSYVRRIMPPQQSTLEYNRTFEWHHLGANYDFYMLDDLLKSPKLDQYKAVIMAANYAVSKEQRELIRERLQRNGRTLVWFYAPGYFCQDGSVINKDAAYTGISGFKLAVDDKLHNLAIKTADGKISGRFTTDIYGGFTVPTRPVKVRPETFRPRFRVVPENGVEIFGHYADDHAPAAAIRRFKDHTAVYWGSTALNKEVLRPVLEQAGVHFYTSMPAVVYANGNFLTVHSPVAGKRTIRLPRKVEMIYDLHREKELAANSDQVTVEMEKNSSVLLYFGDRKAFFSALKKVDSAAAEREKRNAAERPKYKFTMTKKKAQAKAADPGKLYAVDPMGFIRFWQLLGPFANCEKNPSHNIDFLNGEAKAAADKNAVYTAVFDAASPGRDLERSLWFNGKAEKKVLQLKWRPIEFSKGIVVPLFDEVTDFPFYDRIAYYVFCKVVSDKPDRRVILAVGSDDGEKCWFNGELATSISVVSRSVVPDTEKAAVMLKKGENTLLLKVSQGQGKLGHVVRFLDPASGKPVTDVKISLQ